MLPKLFSDVYIVQFNVFSLSCHSLAMHFWQYFSPCYLLRHYDLFFLFLWSSLFIFFWQFILCFLLSKILFLVLLRFVHRNLIRAQNLRWYKPMAHTCVSIYSPTSWWIKDTDLVTSFLKYRFFEQWKHTWNKIIIIFLTHY